VAEGRGEAPAGGQADLGRDELYRRHHRDREQRGPQEAEAERGARDRVGGDAGRVVVGRARDDARAEDPRASGDPGMYPRMRISRAPQQIPKALPKMIREASSEELQEALQHHLDQTKGHVERLERVFEEIGAPARGEKCKGMVGLIEEGADILKEKAENSVRDAGIIAAAQRVEHYEMAVYGTLRTYAKTLGHDEAVPLLEETLREEKAADKKLTEIAESAVNVRAVEGDGNGASPRAARAEAEPTDESGEDDDEDDES
jgi:ferritin-like metal-binding protein YciE